MGGKKRMVDKKVVGNNVVLKALAYTNPMIIPIGVGVFLGCFFESLFGGTVRNIKRVLR